MLNELDLLRTSMMNIKEAARTPNTSKNKAPCTCSICSVTGPASEVD